jgi:DNA polymerase-3 subunit beta
MNIECIKEKLAWALGKAERVTGKNVALPILSCILLEAKDSTLTIKSTNLDLGLEISLPVKVINPGTVAVSGSILNNFVSSVSGDKNIVLEEVSGNLKVSTKHSHSLIKCMPIDDFPIIPKVAADVPLKFNINDFLKGLKSVVYSTSTSTIRPALSSVFINSEEESVVFAATDSFRLAEKKIKTKKHEEFSSLLLPFKNVSEIARTFEGFSGEMEVLINQNQIAFVYENIYLTSRLIDAVFPDYKQIIPKEIKTEVVLLKQDLLTALKISNIFLDTFSRVTIQVSSKDKTITLITKNMDVGESTQTIDAVVKGDDITVSFSYKYIIDCFQSIDSDSVTLSFMDISRPMVITPVSDKSFLYLVMPMNK